MQGCWGCLDHAFARLRPCFSPSPTPIALPSAAPTGCSCAWRAPRNGGKFSKAKGIARKLAWVEERQELTPTRGALHGDPPSCELGPEWARLHI